jgi:hypothetical protein
MGAVLTSLAGGASYMTVRAARDHRCEQLRFPPHN